MGIRAGHVLVFVMLVICTLANASNQVTSDVTDMSIDHQLTSKNEDSTLTATSEQFCTLCTAYTTQFVEYFSKEDTQTEIISTLHEACSYLHTFKHKCVTLVEYYAPIFFVEVAKMQPKLICEKLSLCEDMVPVNLQKHEDLCTTCNRVVAEVLTKLHDPDTQLDIIETLLKGCSRVENFEQECKKLVFQYGPIILANADKFLETTDVCAAIHVCKAKGKPNSLGELLRSSA